MPYGVTWKQFGNDLKNEMQDDDVIDKAAALSYYLMLALFPAMIVLLSLLPYLPIDNLQQAVMDLVRQSLPGETATMLTDTITGVVSEKKGGLLSFGILFTLWAASSGTNAVIQQVNRTYDAEDTRPFWKVRGLAILLALFLFVLVASAFAMIVLGGVLQNWLVNQFGFEGIVLTFFAILRWVIIAAALLLAFAVTYYYAPNVEQKFKFVSPGAILGVVLLAAASLGFKLYVENFGSYNATYGSIGAVIILMLWLQIAGLVILLGSEVNALIEHYHPEGKNKGEKFKGQGGTRDAHLTSVQRPHPSH